MLPLWLILTAVKCSYVNFLGRPQVCLGPGAGCLWVLGWGVLFYFLGFHALPVFHDHVPYTWIMKSSISGACARSVCLSATKESTFKEVDNLSVYMWIRSCTVYMYLWCLLALVKSPSSAITVSPSSSKSPQIIITDYGSDSSTFNFILPTDQVFCFRNLIYLTLLWYADKS